METPAVYVVFLEVSNVEREECVRGRVFRVDREFSLSPGEPLASGYPTTLVRRPTGLRTVGPEYAEARVVGDMGQVALIIARAFARALFKEK